MTEHAKIDKLELIARQFFIGLAAALVGALTFGSLSFYANNGLSLFNDGLCAVIGAGFGMIIGVGLASCAYLQISAFGRPFWVLMLRGTGGFVSGVTAVYLTLLVIRVLLSAGITETASTGSWLTILMGLLPLVGTVAGVNFRLPQFTTVDGVR